MCRSIPIERGCAEPTTDQECSLLTLGERLEGHCKHLCGEKRYRLFSLGGGSHLRRMTVTVMVKVQKKKKKKLVPVVNHLPV